MLIGSLLLLGCLKITAHPVHVSVLNIEITRKKSILAVKLFKDDLQLAIYHSYATEIPLDSVANNEYSTHIIRYLQDNLIIFREKERKIQLQYTGNETNEEAVWLYFSAGNLQSVKHLFLINTIFLDIYEDQTNLVIINNKGNQKGYRFNILQSERKILLNE